MLHNAHPKRNIGSAKRDKPSEVKSGTSTFAPSLTTAIIFRRAGSHDRYRKRGLHFPMDEDKLVKVQGCSHKRNTRREYKRLQTTERLIYLFIQTKYEDSLQEEDKKKMNNHTSLSFLHFPYNRFGQV